MDPFEDPDDFDDWEDCDPYPDWKPYRQNGRLSIRDGRWASKRLKHKKAKS